MVRAPATSDTYRFTRANFLVKSQSDQSFDNFLQYLLIIYAFSFLGVSGGWSGWSSWSSCSPECFQHRRRTCTNPEPIQGGHYCEGIDLQSRNCSHGFCQGRLELLKLISIYKLPKYKETRANLGGPLLRSHRSAK